MSKPKADITFLWTSICINDDLKAFEVFFHLINARLIKFCMFYVHQKETAEDIVAEVMIRCWENRKNLTGVINPETYLFVAVKNQSLNYLKKYSNIHLVQIENSNSVEFVNIYDPQRELEKKELHIIMDKAINTLSPQCSIIFRLVKEDGMKHKEVAEILNISPRTVQTQLFRAVKKLAVALETHRSTQKTNSKEPGINLSAIGNIALIIIAKIFFTNV